MQHMADVIADAYALGSGPWTVEPVTRGALGQIWKLSGNGSSWAVKELLFGCDEAQVRRESALRDAAEELGIASPRLLPNRAGTHVSRLAPTPDGSDGSYVKLYDWVDGTRADASDPEILSWCGRTLALLHTAGAGTSEALDPWYEQCPEAADWARLHEGVRRAGLPWSDALGRFIATSATDLAPHVTPSGTGDRVTSHLDVQPQNVLVGPTGPVLLDWDNAGPIPAGRELARAVYIWSGGNHFDATAARRVLRAYREAGGGPVVKGLDSFSMLFATALNYIRVQTESAIDPTLTPAQRDFASHQAVTSLHTVPDLTAVSRLAETLDAEY
ncbi:Phosphotransferase enzyme family protein [Streptomyces sp. yr375]|uniref:phosphotransferase enzyme family protein n=1 Tax=Streptomyces sp. yr375 TaxID=1761906 RepID=UPI0008B8D07C|nr:phosphotransferase [Streptomyces sp. yr375]SER09519.1 Phosphotransferase enzyme family protein [Streptomyces sp. yr375]